MAEQVVAHDLGVTWDPNAPDALLLDGFGKTVLALNPHHDDPDWRCANSPKKSCVLITVKEAL